MNLITVLNLFFVTATLNNSPRASAFRHCKQIVRAPHISISLIIIGLAIIRKRVFMNTCRCFASRQRRKAFGPRTLGPLGPSLGPLMSCLSFDRLSVLRKYLKRDPKLLDPDLLSVGLGNPLSVS